MRGLGIALSLVAAMVVLAWLAPATEPPPMREGMVLVPSGRFIMGSDEVEGKPAGAELGLHKPPYLDEHPRRTLFLHRYFIDPYEVTNMEYSRFVLGDRRPSPPHWKGGAVPAGEEKYPVVNVNWYEARDYCLWAGKRLPTESEWEKAGRGPEGNLYPWGNGFDPSRGNVGQAGRGGSVPVGSYPLDKSVYGVYDLAGNVMEWTADWYEPYPGSDYSSEEFGEQFRVARGDAFGSSGHYYLSLFTRLTYRQNVAPEERYPFLGFRCALDG